MIVAEIVVAEIWARTSAKPTARRRRRPCGAGKKVAPSSEVHGHMRFDVQSAETNNSTKKTGTSNITPPGLA